MQLLTEKATLEYRPVRWGSESCRYLESVPKWEYSKCKDLQVEWVGRFQTGKEADVAGEAWVRDVWCETSQHCWGPPGENGGIWAVGWHDFSFNLITLARVEAGRPVRSFCNNLSKVKVARLGWQQGCSKLDFGYNLQIRMTRTC